MPYLNPCLILQYQPPSHILLALLCFFSSSSSASFPQDLSREFFGPTDATNWCFFFCSSFLVSCPNHQFHRFKNPNLPTVTHFHIPERTDVTLSLWVVQMKRTLATHPDSKQINTIRQTAQMLWSAEPTKGYRWSDILMNDLFVSVPPDKYITEPLPFLIGLTEWRLDLSALKYSKRQKLKQI